MRGGVRGGDLGRRPVPLVDASRGFEVCVHSTTRSHYLVGSAPLPVNWRGLCLEPHIRSRITSLGRCQSSEWFPVVILEHIRRRDGAGSGDQLERPTARTAPSGRSDRGHDSRTVPARHTIGMRPMRTGLLWMARNTWMKEHLPKLPFAQKAVRRFMPGEEVDDAIDAADRLDGEG